MRAAGSRLLSDEGWDGEQPLVALAPGAAFGGAKRWPPLHFATLVGELAGEGIRSVMVGGAGDRATGIDIEQLLPAGTRAINVIGRTDLAAFGGVLAHSRSLVTNDSGAMHFAAAIGVRVVALFGSTDERRTAPLGRRPATILTHAVWCSPCMMRECPIDHRCMRGISVDEVLSATRRMI
jgi:heptosyltransferase-2